MKIRNLNQLQDTLDGSIAWRIKEISYLKNTVKNARDLKKATAIRAGVALLYAHWEGFVKEAAEAYVNFVANRHLNIDQLSSNFAMLAVKGKIEEIKSSKQAGINISVVDFFRNGLSNTARIDINKAINTESNLSSKVFENIALTIGVKIDRYTTRYNLLDETLLKSRNNIAHGEYLLVDETAFEGLVVEISTLLRWVKDDIENSAVLGSYKNSNNLSSI